MKINEVGKGSRVTVTAVKGAMKTDLESESIVGHDQGLLVSIIKHGGKPVKFSVDSRVCLDAVIISEEDIPYMWKNIRITTASYAGELCSLLVSDEDVGCMNRRETYRLYLGIDGTVKLGNNKCAYEVIIKDISETGIAFVCEKDLDVSARDIANIKFYDSKNRAKFDVRVNILRKVSNDEGDKYIYGCKLLTPSEGIRKYVNERQRERQKERNTRCSYR